MADETYSELVAFRDLPSIKAALERRARDEGTDVTAIIRRAVRRELFRVSDVPTGGNVPDEKAAEPAPAPAAA